MMHVNDALCRQCMRANCTKVWSRRKRDVVWSIIVITVALWLHSITYLMHTAVWVIQNQPWHGRCATHNDHLRHLHHPITRYL